MTIYERIRYLRTKAGMTQDDLARVMGYKDRSMITKIEAGKVDISQTKIVEFANALNTTPAYLMGWIEQSFDEASEKEEYSPKTTQARSLAKGVDRMPPAQRDAIMNLMIGLYPGIFEKGIDDDDT